MTYTEILEERRGPVCWLYLNRPKEMNALTATMTVELADALARARDDDGVRVVVFSGKGRAFCAGADLKAVPDPGAPPGPEPDFVDVSLRMFALLDDYPKVTITALNGFTCAGGLELTMCTDIVCAARSARIGDAHSNFALLPGAGGSVRLPKIVGAMRAKYLMLTGDLLPAETLQHMGLVAVVTNDDELEAQVQALAERLADKSPLVMRRMKELVKDSYDVPTAQALKHEVATMRQHVRSHDVAEGLAAFQSKRKPNFKGY